MTSSIKLHLHPLSGHCHRVELFLSILGVAYEPVHVDLLQGEQKTPRFLNLNSFGQVPVLEDGALALSDSNAILVYLALRYDREGRWYPREPAAAAEVQRWLSVAAGELVRGPGALRLHALLKAPVDKAIAERIAGDLLRALDQTLANRAFLGGDAPTIADLAMYAYTERAPEGGLSLEAYPAVRAWHARVEALKGFVPMRRAS
jgi:glutathione S-transferase